MNTNGITFASMAELIQFSTFVTDSQTRVAEQSVTIDVLSAEVTVMDRELATLRGQRDQLAQKVDQLTQDKIYLQDRIASLQGMNARANSPFGEFSEVAVEMIKILLRDHPTLARNMLSDFLPGEKIQQIKFVRTVTNCGLKDGKEWVEGSDNRLEPRNCG